MQIFTDSGIWTHFFLIFGFPTETHKEARETKDFILKNNKIIRSMSFGSFQLTKHSKVYDNPNLYSVNRIIQDNNTDLSLWYDYENNTGMSKRETDDAIKEFYNELTHQFRDLPIWSNLGEHLFLYISNYKKARNEVADLSVLIDEIDSRRKSLHKPIDIL